MKNTLLVFIMAILSTVIAQETIKPPNKAIPKQKNTYSKGSYSIVFSEDSGSYGLTNHEKREILLPSIFSNIQPIPEDTLSFLVFGSNEPLVGIYNVNNGFVLPMIYTSIEYIKQQNSFLYLVKKSEKIGLLRRDLSILLPIEHDEITILNTAPLLGIVMDYDIGTSTGLITQSQKLYGLFNISLNQMVIPIKYENLSFVQELGILAVKEGRVTILDAYGKRLWKGQYDRMNITGSDEVLVLQNGLMGILNYREKERIPIRYKQLYKQDDRWLATDQSDQMGVMNSRGNVLIPFRYGSIVFQKYFICHGKLGDALYVNTSSGVQKLLDADAYSLEYYGDNGFKAKIKQRYGWVDGRGKTVIAAQYDDILPFGKSYVLVQNQSFTIYNPECPDAAKLKYDRIERPSTNSKILIASIRGKSGLIDPCGQEIHPFIFESIESRSGDFLIVKQDEKYGIYHLKKNKYLVKPIYDFIEKNGQHYITFIGEKTQSISVLGDSLRVNAINEMLTSKDRVDTALTKIKIGMHLPYMIIVSRELGGLHYGVWDQVSRKVLIPPFFKTIMKVQNQFNDFVVGIENYGIYRIGKGLALPMRYKNITEVSSGQSCAYIVQNNNNKGVINADFSEGLPLEYEEITLADKKSLKDFLIITKNVANEHFMGMYHWPSQKTIVEPTKYKYVSFFYNKEIGLVKKEGLYNLIDLQGKTLFKDWYDQIEIMTKDRFIVCKKSLYRVIDRNEAPIVPWTNTRIWKAYGSTKHYLVENLDRKSSLIDESGKWIVPYEKFDYITHTQDGNGYYFITKTKNKYAFYKLTPDTLLKIYSDNLDTMEAYYNLPFIKIKKEGRWGLMNREGHWLIPNAYDNITYIFMGGSGFFIATFKTKKQLYDINCKSLITTQFDKVEGLGLSFGQVYKDSKVAVLGACGDVLTPYFDEIVGGFKDYLIIKVKDKYGVYHLPSQKYSLNPEFEMINPMFYEGFLVSDNKKFTKYYFKNGIELNRKEY